MPSFRIATPARAYDAVIERGILRRAVEFLPARTGKLFVVTTEDVWGRHGAQLEAALKQQPPTVLFFPGGEERKRIAEVEALAEQMVAAGGDRTSVVVAFGGGIVNDLGGFLASIFMRGVPVLQIPTTLLAQVDAAIGGKTGANLQSGKNLIGTFHQPLAVLIDPDVIATLPDREYRAGLHEIIKAGIIVDLELFEIFENQRERVLRRDPAVLEHVIAAAVRIKAEVVSQDEKESGLRRILNFGHTIGHALEAETNYARLLHGEAVAFGMIAAARIAVDAAGLPAADAERIAEVVQAYGPIPPLDGIEPERLVARLASDKKTLQGKVHFVLPVRIGAVKVLSGIPETRVIAAIEWALERYREARAIA
jgi:3-dehydroquinate synthase